MDQLVKNMLREPRKPHRKEKAIVPGVHRLAPPEGRLTLSLLDERGRVIHRTEAHNSVTNQLRECVMTWVRGNDNAGWYGLDSGVFQNGQHGVFTDVAYSAVGSAYPHVYAHMTQFLSSIYLSSSSAAVDPDWWFPLGLEAGARIDANNTFTDNAKRGHRQTAHMIRTNDSMLYVVDFNLNEANGFSIESVGLAGLRYPGTDTYNGVYGWITANMFALSGGSGIAQTRVSSTTPVPGSPTKLWIYGSDGSWEIDFALGVYPSNWTTTALRTVTGPVPATWGASVNNTGIAIIGTDFWIMDTTRLRRTAIPTSTSLPTVHNTYSPVTGFTDAACLDMTTDGTNLYAIGSTKVFVISPITGAVTSSWDHNLTGAHSVTYDDVHDILWLIGQENPSYSRDGYLVNNSIVQNGGDVVHSATNSGFSAPYPFTKSGTSLGYGLQGFYTNSSSAEIDTLTLWDSGRYIWVNFYPATSAFNNNGGVQSGGVLGTRALVDSPFTKTSANPLRVEYEVEFL